MTGRHARVPWWQREAVRVRGYTVAAAVLGILVLREWITEPEAGYILLALSSLLGVWGIETSRQSTVANTVVKREVAPLVAAEVVDKGVDPEEAAADTLRTMEEEQ